MDGDHLRSVAQEGEPVAVMADTSDWRNGLSREQRDRIINKILETVKRNLPFNGEDGLQELNKIAERFEGKIYTAATSQSDYLRKISLKMLTMETKSQNSLPNPLASNSAGTLNKFQNFGVIGMASNFVSTKGMKASAPYGGNNLRLIVHEGNMKGTAPYTGYSFRPTAHEGEMNASAPYRGNSLKRTAHEGERVMDTNDWRSQLEIGSRHRIINKIEETLKRHLPFSGEEGLREVQKIATGIEEKIYATATSQCDYLRKISLKMLTMETKSQNPYPLACNSVLNNNKFPDPGAAHSMLPQVQNLNQAAPSRLSADQHKEQLLEQVKKQKVELVNLKQMLVQLQVQQQNLLPPTQRQSSEQSGMQTLSTESSPLPSLQQNLQTSVQQSK